MRICSINDCENNSRKLGLCVKHYYRWYRHGDVNVVRQRGAKPGDKNPSWLGSEIAYGGMHTRLGTVLGKAARHICSRCPNQAQEWAYTHDDPNEKTWINQQGYLVAYSTDVEKYIPLCLSCHRTLDRAVKAVV